MKTEKPNTQNQPEISKKEVAAGKLFKKILTESLDSLLAKAQKIEEGGLYEAVRIVLHEEIWRVEDKITRLDLVAYLSEEESLEELQMLDFNGDLDSGEYEKLTKEGVVAENIQNYTKTLYTKLNALREASMSLDPIQRLMDVSGGENGIISNTQLAEIMQKARLKDADLDLERESVVETAGEGLGELDLQILKQAEDFVQKEAEKKTEFFETRERVIKAFKQRKRPKVETRKEEEEDENIQKIIDDLSENVEEFQRMKASLPEHIQNQISQIIKDREQIAPLRKEIKDTVARAERSWSGLKQKLAMAEGTPEQTVKRYQNEMVRYFDLMGQISESRKALEDARYSTLEKSVVESELKPAKEKELPRINNVLWVELERVKENDIIAGVTRDEVARLVASSEEKDWDTAIVLSNLVERINQGKSQYALKEVEDLKSAQRIPLEVYSSIISRAGKLLPAQDSKK